MIADTVHRTRTNDQRKHRFDANTISSNANTKQTNVQPANANANTMRTTVQLLRTDFHADPVDFMATSFPASHPSQPHQLRQYYQMPARQPKPAQPTSIFHQPSQPAQPCQPPDPTSSEREREQNTNCERERKHCANKTPAANSDANTTLCEQQTANTILAECEHVQCRTANTTANADMRYSNSEHRSLPTLIFFI